MSVHSLTDASQVISYSLYSLVLDGTIPGDFSAKRLLLILSIRASLNNPPISLFLFYCLLRLCKHTNPHTQRHIPSEPLPPKH